MATLRRDGSPRICGTEKVAGTAHEVTEPGVIAVLAAAVSAEASPEDRAAPGSFELFRLDLTEVVVVRVGDGQLLIESWHQGRGMRRAER